MNSNNIRASFLFFFESKGHAIVPSAPMVIKNDPTLMFTNAGMNQFKEIFLGNAQTQYKRVADSQKCLRVSGKHNDLEEVGRDTYHHTMFEMLGNWSFGDYFKKEAIDYAWEFLTKVLKLDPERFYTTVYEGSEEDKVEADLESREYWKKYLPESRILFGNKKDNFWEMGDTGPCGPCSEIHIDLRPEDERAETDGASLVNKDHPLVVELWNLVFIQFNRMASGELVPLAEKHVDTGMGFERLCMAVQGKTSTYDTDIFTSLIEKISFLAGKKYGEDENVDIAMRVIADHLRAVGFAIADGQLPSNTGAGYVIRRILRRAIRYGYTFLGFEEPVIYTVVADLTSLMGGHYPELIKNRSLIENVIKEEELSFLRTLSHGVTKFENYCARLGDKKEIDGDFAFELFDTYGFPIDLTQLMAKEKDLTVDMAGFQKGLDEQKKRSREAAAVSTDDWVEIIPGHPGTRFVGYHSLESESKIVKYRKVTTKNKQFYQLVLDQTPFYAEAGGQVGDVGILVSETEKIFIENTIKENNLIVHQTTILPVNLTAVFKATVNEKIRTETQNNHTATHLIHMALRQVLGDHIEQRGSLVTPERIRFDFSHYGKVTDDELKEVEILANKLVRANIPLEEMMDIPLDEARSMGAMALFGEKYGEKVRVVRFGDSIELCGGTHAPATGSVGCVKIVYETAVASGIRRIEAMTGFYAQNHVYHYITLVNQLKDALNSSNLLQSVNKLKEENESLKKEIENYQQDRVASLISQLNKEVENINGIRVIRNFNKMSMDSLKQAAFHLRENKENLVVVLGSDFEDKVNIALALSDDMVEKGWNASQLMKNISPIIMGGGGGQPKLATAGGKNYMKVEEAMDEIIRLITD